MIIQIQTEWIKTSRFFLTKSQSWVRLLFTSFSEKALSSVQELLERTVTEKDQMHRLFEDSKGHLDVIKRQCNAYERRLVDEITARKELERDYEFKLGQMKSAIE